MVGANRARGRHGPIGFSHPLCLLLQLTNDKLPNRADPIVPTSGERTRLIRHLPRPRRSALIKSNMTVSDYDMPF